MEKHRPKKERFSLFGLRSSGRSTSSSSSTSAPPIPPTLCKTDPHPSIPPSLRKTDPHPSIPPSLRKTDPHPSIPPSLRKTDPHPSIAPSIPPGPPILSKTEFLEAVRCSNQACQRGQYSQAVQLYGKALSADPQNCILYSNRSAAHLRLGQYQTALDDALKARLLNPKWPKRSLGLNWDLRTDTFTFKVAKDEKPFTRRGVLSTLNSLYDPLGFVAPVTIQEIDIELDDTTFHTDSEVVLGYIYNETRRFYVYVSN
ncbi:uncharacterized protein LOC120044802 [Salvelinus namaycush]|uniref:Uncharacterized protein LOC120044802 n=1 Tax=Salvelinus namaycush TaxID=8040 RepID=A0A8U0UA93_SALNM|nr:uncharacterized protein LOC120044802 [Salvelinus namaycush]